MNRDLEAFWRSRRDEIERERRLHNAFVVVSCIVLAIVVIGVVAWGGVSMNLVQNRVK